MGALTYLGAWPQGGRARKPLLMESGALSCHPELSLNHLESPPFVSSLKFLRGLVLQVNNFPGISPTLLGPSSERVNWTAEVLCELWLCARVCPLYMEILEFIVFMRQKEPRKGQLCTKSMAHLQA